MACDTALQPLFEQLLADPSLDAAYEWHAEATENPLDWAAAKEDLRARLAGGEYAFQPLHRVHTADGPVEQWNETDRIVFKAMILVLQSALGERSSRNVHHLRGGAQEAVEEIHDHLAGSPDSWVMRSDVEGYYAHIDHDILYNQVFRLIPAEKYLLRLVWQYLRHSVEDGGEFEDIERGIARGCSLSPLMGAGLGSSSGRRWPGVQKRSFWTLHKSAPEDLRASPAGARRRDAPSKSYALRATLLHSSLTGGRN